MGVQPYLGTIVPIAGTFAPKGWALCWGQVLSIQQNQALFSLLGTTYGGNGTTTFALPDLRGRCAVGVGQGPGLTARNYGQVFGQTAQSLVVSEIPPHTHQVRVVPSEGTGASLVGRSLAKASDGRNRWGSTATGPMALAAVSNAGFGVAHQNLQPSLGLNWIIALQGLFPPRP